MAKLPTLTTFQRDALGTLLWSESDIDENGNSESFLDCAPGTHFACGCDVPVEDFEFDEEGIAEFIKGCDSFLDDVRSAGIPFDECQLAGDFILTRNRHGAGFWDGGWPEHGDKLTKMAKAYGTVGLMRGDDGKLYFHN